MDWTPKTLPKLHGKRIKEQPNIMNKKVSFEKSGNYIEAPFILSEGILYSNRPQIIWDEQIIIDDFYTGREFSWKSNGTGEIIKLNNAVLYGRDRERIEIKYNGHREIITLRIEPDKITEELKKIIKGVE